MPRGLTRFGLALMLGGAIVASMALARPSAEAVADPVTGKKICVDAGHGGSDPGAVNGALHEADINLDVARALEAAWVARGATVTMTRTSDVALSSRDRYTTCNSAKADILISVHTNSLANAAPDGTMTIYFSPDDRVLAGYLQRSMHGALSGGVPHTFTNYGLKKDALGVLLKSTMASATIEPVLMSNFWEAERLAPTIAACPNASSTDCRRAQIVQAVLAGVDAYFSSR